MAPGLQYSTPAAEELERRRTIGIGVETVTNIPSTDFPHHYPGEDNSWDLENFRNALKVVIHTNPDPLDLTFSLIGIDASVANAFRRIVIAEVPTLAIERCYIANNTSIVQDEVLANRLGLIPLKGNKKFIRGMTWRPKPTEENPGPFPPKDTDSIYFNLKIECTAKKGVKDTETDPMERFNNAHIYAKHLLFTPLGALQTTLLAGSEAIQPVHPGILIAKLRPEQALDLELQCVKGIGADHAKFSPVATATYRLMSQITITKPIIGADAKKFAQCFPPGVIGLETISAADAQAQPSHFKGHEGELKAVVRDPMRDTVSRECLRHEEFVGKVKLGRKKDHFIYSIESTGQFDSDELFLESVKILALKCRVMKRNMERIYTEQS